MGDVLGPFEGSWVSIACSGEDVDGLADLWDRGGAQSQESLAAQGAEPYPTLVSAETCQSAPAFPWSPTPQLVGTAASKHDSLVKTRFEEVPAI